MLELPQNLEVIECQPPCPPLIPMARSLASWLCGCPSALSFSQPLQCRTGLSRGCSGSSTGYSALYLRCGRGYGETMLSSFKTFQCLFLEMSDP